MLPKQLLDVRKYKPEIAPIYREPGEYRDVARAVIDAYVAERDRGEIEEAVAGLETHDNVNLVRGLSELLERRSTFETRSPVPPAKLRHAAFRRGYVTGQEEREVVVTAVAEEFELRNADVESGLWADREHRAVLTSPPDIEPEALVRQYNLSLTQTLLFDALELEWRTSDNFQRIFALVKYLGLMYSVDPELRVSVTGPAALFKRTRKYGTTLARLVPSIMQATEWELSAAVETEVSGERRVYDFEIDASQSRLFPDAEPVESFDSEVERDFATRISALADDWTVIREPTILRADERVMIPDFSFERNGERFYLEVVGFWTPEYLQEKIEKVRAVEREYPLVLAVNSSLDCTEANFAGADEVFFYDDRIPVKPVMDRLNRIDRRIIEADLEELRERGIELSEEVIDIEALARSEAIEPGALKRYLRKRDQGIISQGTYLNDAALEALRTEIETANGDTLSDVNHILESYDVGQEVLEELGYAIEYVSLDQDEAKIRKR